MPLKKVRNTRNTLLFPSAYFVVVLFGVFFVKYRSRFTAKIFLN